LKKTDHHRPSLGIRRDDSIVNEHPRALQRASLIYRRRCAKNHAARNYFCQNRIGRAELRKNLLADATFEL
jgi:hypothetical protein